MKTTHSKKIQILLLAVLSLSSCVTSPLGRQQLILVPDSQMDQMGAQAFQQVKATEKPNQNTRTQKYVQCVVDPILQSIRGKTAVDQWEVEVFENSQVNAFALPGGKIGVYTGLLNVAKTDAQLAAVIGHEVGHVMAKHGAERVSQQAGTQLGLAALGMVTPNNPNKNTLMGLLGLGLQVGVLLPYSRTQESEADVIGLGLMAESGFDPAQSVDLWKNMGAASGGQQPPVLLSTHPGHEERIANLQQHIPEAQKLYEQAKASGRKPHCSR